MLYQTIQQNFNKKATLTYLRNIALITAVVYFGGIFPMFSLSNSLNTHVFIFNKYARSFELNDYVYFKHPLPGQTSDMPIIKRIAAVAGDKISTLNNTLYINNQAIAKLQLLTAYGVKIHPIKSQTVPEGLVFVLGEHERSFDSRYQEMGLVPLHKVKKVYALF